VSFDKDYSQLIRYASAIVKNQGLLIDAGDLINDAYIKLVESGKEYTPEFFKKLISNCSFAEIDYKEKLKPESKDRESCCSRCGESKPAYNFYKMAYKLRRQCVQCTLEIMKAKYVKNKEDILERNRRYKEANKDKIRTQRRIKYYTERKKSHPDLEQRKEQRKKQSEANAIRRREKRNVENRLKTQQRKEARIKEAEELRKVIQIEAEQERKHFLEEKEKDRLKREQEKKTKIAA
jgi:hypothetical protein